MGIALGGGQAAVGRFELQRIAVAVLDGDDIWNAGSHAHAFEDRGLDGGAPATVGRVKREDRRRGTNGQMLICCSGRAVRGLRYVSGRTCSTSRLPAEYAARQITGGT